MRHSLWILLILCSISIVFATEYAGPPNPENAPLVHSGISFIAPPNAENVPLLHGPEVQINGTGPVIVNACGPNITVFHNMNLNCTFNATDPNEQELVWAVNDSRIQMISKNTSGQVFDNPTLQEYNLPGCWNIKVNVTDTDNESTSTTFNYCINDTAPAFNETLANITVFNTQNYSQYYNWSDVEGDNASIALNCTGLNATINNVTHTVLFTRIADNGTAFVQICRATLNDTILASSRDIVLNVTTDPATVANYTITNGTNMSGLNPVLNFTGISNQSILRFNYTYNLMWFYNRSQQNQTVSNPFLYFNNTDSQDLCIRCNITILLQGITVKLSLNFSGINESRITGNNTLVACGRPANSSTRVWAFFDYVAYNYTVQRNDSTALICEMKVS